MTEVGHADLSRLLQSRRNECSAIVTSRKRKLRELFAVATRVDALPGDGFTNPDAPAATPVEWQFLQASDLLQGKTLNEPNIPPRPRPSLGKLEKLKRSFVTGHAAPAAPAAPACIVEKGPAKVHKGAPPFTASVVKNKDALPKARKGMTPAISAKATPIPQPQKPVSQSPLTPGRFAEANSKPVAPLELSTMNGNDGNARKFQGDTNAFFPTEERVVHRSTHVKFSPGTKGPPSTDATKDGPVNPDSGNAPARTTDDKAGMSSAGTYTGCNGSLAIKLPVDTPRVPEALSTPGSTASAVTPAAHDASTDTSPENDGLRYRDVVERKESGASAGVKSREGALDVPDQSLSAEEQLLQESIQSSVAASKHRGETLRAAAGPKSDALNAAATTRDAVSGDTSKPASASGKALPPCSASPTRHHVAEVPDSQGATPEEMDVDPAETKPGAQSQNIPPSRESELSPQGAPMVSPAENPPPKEQPQASERAVTRVSSGALRRKSVNEIVGGISRPSIHTSRDSFTKGFHDQLTPVTSTPQSPASRARNSVASRKDRAKSHASTVLFGKQPKRLEDKALVTGHKETMQASDDYYTPLLVQNFTTSSSWMQPLERILFQANKSISTPDAHLVIQDLQACRILRRVYHLQQHDKWSLRQPKRCPEPTRPPSQWDVLLQEMKWMRTDFREERKWKMAVARNLAHACVEWHEATPEERKCLQVVAVIPPQPGSVAGDLSMADADEDGAENQPTPDLVSSGDVTSPQNMDELVEDFVETVAPSAIFALQEDDVVFGLRRTAASDKLLQELPMYGPPLKVPKSDVAAPDYDPDAHWRRPALPLSKYVEGEMKLAYNRPPQRRGRYDYVNEDSDSDNGDLLNDFVGDELVHNIKLPPSTDEVSMFHPESRHIRDRLHAGHQFRPPSEHPMPAQSFYESRSPSQWTMAEDDELRGLVREYSYNWSLISSLLSTKSFFAAGAERRTPWECFERWINLEGLPADMQKTQYFKAYNSRIEAAQRIIAQQNQLAAQQANASGGTITPVRRRPSVPLRVEKRRNQKHLTMLDAMRKLAKKRETAMQKQQHSSSQNAANKKTNENIPQRPTKTPRDYSLMRWERDQALAEKMAQYAQRQEAQRRAAMQARVQAQAQGSQVAGTPGASGTPVAGAPGQNSAVHPGTNPGVTGVGRPMPNQLAAAAAAAAASQGRPRMPMQAPANGVGAGGVQSQVSGGLSAPAQMNGAPQAQMQGMQGQHRMPMPNQQPDATLMLRAQRISEQQRAAVQIQQAQHQQQQHHQQPQGNPGAPGAASQHSSPLMRNGVNGVNQQTFMNNAQAMMSSYTTAAANGNGLAPAQANGLHMPSAANTPSPGQRVHPQLPPSITAQLTNLEASFRAKNPSLTPEQARQLATEHLTRAMMAQRQNAMNAAAGAAGQPGIANSIAATTSPHQYAALLRQQQQQLQQQQLLQQQQQQQQQHPHPHPHPHPQGQPQKQPQPQPQQLQQHTPTVQAASIAASAAPAATSSASPAAAHHQRAASGSATPSAVGK